MRPRRPGRVKGFPYSGCRRYFLTLCACDRREVFRSPTTVEDVLLQIRRSATDEEFVLVAYCFMPDHVHLLAEGISEASDLRRFVTLFKQRSGYRYGRTTSRRLWEVGYYDHVLRDEESTAKVVSYILHNPVKAGLVQRPQDYPYAGSDVFTLQDLLETNPQG